MPDCERSDVRRDVRPLLAGVRGETARRVRSCRCSTVPTCCCRSTPRVFPGPEGKFPDFAPSTPSRLPGPRCRPSGLSDRHAPLPGGNQRSMFLSVVPQCERGRCLPCFVLFGSRGRVPSNPDPLALWRICKCFAPLWLPHCLPTVRMRQRCRQTRTWTRPSSGLPGACSSIPVAPWDYSVP